VSAVADKLREARALIERGWTQLVSARDCDGNPVDCDQPNAVSFCAVGAVSRAYDCDYDASCPAHEIVSRVVGTVWVDQWNDVEERTQAEVLAAFDKAIALAESEQ
jgi:hypothetical protein